MEDQLGTLKNKPWMPINEIREEFANCALLKFGSFSEHDFKVCFGEGVKLKEKVNCKYLKKNNMQKKF